MEKNMEKVGKFLVKTGNFDEIHIYIHGKKAVSVAESLAGDSCYARISGMWIEAVDENLVFVTLFPETAIVFAIAELGKLGFVGLPAQVWVGVQAGPCYEEIFPLSGGFEIPREEEYREKKKGENTMQKIINLTPHTINFVGQDNAIVASIPSSGVARAAQRRKIVDIIEIDGISLPIARCTYGDVQGLPDPMADTIYIVSAITAQAVPERQDVFIVDDSVRDESGRIIGVRGIAHV